MECLILSQNACWKQKIGYKMSGTLRGEIWGLSFAIPHSDFYYIHSESHIYHDLCTNMRIHIWSKIPFLDLTSMYPCYNALSHLKVLLVLTSGVVKKLLPILMKSWVKTLFKTPNSEHPPTYTPGRSSCIRNVIKFRKHGQTINQWLVFP